MNSRRHFMLKSGVGLFAAAALPATTLAGGVWRRRRSKLVSLDELDYASFSNLTDKIFHVPVKDRRLQFKLARTTDQSTQKGENFSLRFVGPVEEPLQQGMYLFDNETLGSFSLFIVPGDATRRLQSYTAIINRVTA